MKMTIDKLEQYYCTVSNIDAIEKELGSLYAHVSSPNGGNGIHSTTPGDPTAKKAMRIIELKEKAEAEQEKMYDLLEEIEEWLSAINDTEIASIVRWHYLLRLNWRQTNMKIYGYPDYSYSRKKLHRYLEKEKLS